MNILEKIELFVEVDLWFFVDDLKEVIAENWIHYLIVFTCSFVGCYLSK